MSKTGSAWRWRGAAALAGSGAVAATLVLGSLGGPASPPAEHEIVVTARSFAFEPAVIRVARGDVLKLRFAATDVVHGFYLEG